NIFAAELLMPLERVHTLYLSEHITPHQLASLFEVSNAAMLNRLVGLLTDSGRLQGSPLLYTNETSLPHENVAEAQPSIVGVGLAPTLHPLAPTLQPSPTLQPTPTTSTPAKKHYDEFQQTAIEAPTPALIVAGPGSGKTSTLIGRVEYLIQTLGVPPES